jgi:hypothetical protein
MGEERLECLKRVPDVGRVVISTCGLGIRRLAGVERPAAEGQQDQPSGEAAPPPELPLHSPEMLFKRFDAFR